MSLILCRQENVRNPYYFESLGVHIYSSQELCYLMYHNPILVMDDFIDDHLIEFIRSELGMEFLAVKLAKWRESKENQDEMLTIILQESYYYRAPEISRFSQQVSDYRKMHPALYGKEKADYLFLRRQYGKAVSQYKKVLERPDDRFYGGDFKAVIWNNTGACYARMFLYEKAYDCYKNAFDLSGDIQMVQKLYYLRSYKPDLENMDAYAAFFTEDAIQQWEEHLMRAKEQAQNANSLKYLNELFQKDPVKRMAGSTAVVRKWKQEYRNMI